MDTNKLPGLHQSLIKALDFFITNPPQKLNIKITDQLFIVGSGNAYNTGQIIFANSPTIFANESNLRQKLKTYSKLIKKKVIKQAVIISASGEKDAIWEIKEIKKYGLKTILMTCNKNSKGAKIAEEVIVYNKLPEPQTYNISTYLGMIIAATGEKAINIKNFLNKIKLPAKFSTYQAFAFILPDNFAQITPMFDIKKHELFGPHVSIRSFSEGDARHAKFVMPWEKELVISFGKNKYFGLPAHRWQINLPTKYSAGLIMSLGYYLIGKIQQDKPPYYKKNIQKYCQEGPRAYGKKEPFSIIVS